MSATLHELSVLLAKGGFVAPPLVVGALLLWFAIGYRFILLFAMDRRPARALFEAAANGRLVRPRGVVAKAAAQGWSLVQSPRRNLRSVLEELNHDHRLELSRWSGLVSGIVKIAPLLGLLGTVSGMIDTFDSLGDTSAAASAGAGVAGGISEALFSTQMGLLVAIPGLLMGRLLDRRQLVIEEELEKLEDVIVTQSGRAEENL